MHVCHADRVLDGNQRYCRRRRADPRDGLRFPKDHDVHDRARCRRYCKRSKEDLRDVPRSPSDHDNHVQVKDRNHYHRLAHYDVALHGAPSEVHDAPANVLAEVSFQAFVIEPFVGDGLCHDGQMGRISARSENVP